ncbi:MAG TPA: hypothetical protein VGH83_05655 [Candidatus Acidoferrum sp.]|jgi:hypothetical protein
MKLETKHNLYLLLKAMRRAHEAARRAAGQRMTHPSPETARAAVAAHNAAVAATHRYNYAATMATAPASSASSATRAAALASFLPMGAPCAARCVTEAELRREAARLSPADRAALASLPTG